MNPQSERAEKEIEPQPQRAPEGEFAATLSVPPEQPKKVSFEIARKMLLISAISSFIAFAVKRTIFPKLKELQPQNLPVTVSESVGFPLTAAAIAAGVIYAKNRKPDDLVSRRGFFYIAASAAGALGGSVLADVSAGLRRSPVDVSATGSPASDSQAPASESDISK